MGNTTDNGALVTVRAANANDPRLARAVAWTSIADDFVVEDEDLFELAAGEVSELTRVYNEIEAQRQGIVEPLNLALRNANAVFMPVLRKIEAAKKLLGQRMTEFRERERQRIARENAQREAAAAVEREKIDAKAKAAQAAGRDEEAFAIRQTSQLVSAPIVPSAPRKIPGVSTRSTWSAECLDLAALVQWVAKHPEHVNLLQANTTALNQTARANQGALKIDGVRFYEKGSAVVRGR